MKKFLKYSFIFEPAELWTDKDAFESDLSEMFSAKGFEIESVEATEEENERILLIRKSDGSQKEKSNEVKEKKEELADELSETVRKLLNKK